MTPIKAVEDFIHDNFTGDKYYGTPDMIRALVQEVCRDAVAGAAVMTNQACESRKRLLNLAYDYRDLLVAHSFQAEVEEVEAVIAEAEGR